MPRNAALLLGLLVLIVGSPSVSGRGERIVIELIFDAILVAGVYAVGLRRHRWAFATLTVVTLSARWGELLFASGFDIVALTLTAAWLVYAGSVIIASLFQRREVEVDTILGAIVVYLLVGLAFMMVFQVLELRDPGSFSGLPDGVQERPKELAASMLYFSLVCLTTTGFGDIVPVSDFARPSSMLEGVFGQLYLAVMIARLVGLHIAQPRGD